MLEALTKTGPESRRSAARGAGAGDGTCPSLNEAEVEHSTVRQLIEKIEGMSPQDEKRSAHFTVLVEYVKHHVKEEEKAMFPKVKKLESLDLSALGQQMKERKAELMAEMGVDLEELESEEQTA